MACRHFSVFTESKRLCIKLNGCHYTVKRNWMLASMKLATRDILWASAKNFEIVVLKIDKPRKVRNSIKGGCALSVLSATSKCSNFVMWSFENWKRSSFWNGDSARVYVSDSARAFGFFTCFFVNSYSKISFFKRSVLQLTLSYSKKWYRCNSWCGLYNRTLWVHFKIWFYNCHRVAKFRITLPSFYRWKNWYTC